MFEALIRNLDDEELLKYCNEEEIWKLSFDQVATLILELAKRLETERGE